jgi:hypothetical protein
MRDRLWKWLPIVLGLLAIALAASAAEGQQTVVVPDVNVEVEPTPVTIENNINVMSDSTMIENLNRNIEALREQIAADECNTCGQGATTTQKLTLGLAIPVLIWIALELRGIKNKDDIHNVDNNVDVDVNVPPRKKKHGES